MKPVFFTSLNRKRRQAMALILVIITVALLSMLIVAIFSVTRTEYKATQSYVAAKSAKQLGDSAVAIVEAQIQNAQNKTTGPAGKTHATQPGMVRVYQSDGSFESAFKLYSSAIMKVTGDESTLYSDTHVPPSSWHTMPARFVDLNEPVVRPALTSTGTSSTASYAVYFPIIDPRAAWNYSGSQTAGEEGEITTQVEGFSYTKTAPSIGGGGGQDYSTKVVTNTDASTPDRLRLPMPVEWMYVLQDGTLGVLDASNKFIAATGGSSGGGAPTALNPIVGRVAFWTDDESCKININTASEPTFMSTPFYYHERDAKWAHFPPATGEYQRYPGHPATVALSAVLAPNFLLDPMMPVTDGLSKAMDVVDIKEQIYKFAPKIAGGGSEGGTRPFVRDDFSSDRGEREASLKINLDEAVKERLYASVDEMLFVDRDYNTSTGRSPAILTLPNSAGNFFAQDRLEHARFFLTAHSRSPEFSIHGLPRVCMWPVADESKGASFRSSFDNAIALCATIKRNATTAASTARTYFFRRSNSRNSTTDVNLNRNGVLLDYLTTQMSNLNFPATSYSATTTRSNFQAKYGTDNVNQMAIQFFDYIRCTNLYDGIMARKNNAWAANGRTGTAVYMYRDDNDSNFYTYTAARVTEPPSTYNNVTAEQGQSNRRTGGQGGILPGHGQVSPAIWSKGGRSYKGFGRMFTISEIGFQFMCTADGRPDDNLIAPTVNLLSKFASGRRTGDPTRGSGGLTARRYDVGPRNEHPTAGSAYGIDPEDQKAFVPEVDADRDGIPEAYWWSNLPPLLSADDVTNAIEYYACQAQEGSKSHPSRHPGFNPRYWNMTLASGVPLRTNQKRIQVMLALEAFCPSMGWTGMYPEFTVVLDGATIAQMKINGYNADGSVSPQPLFNTVGAVALKSNGNLYGAYDCHTSGGHATPSAFAGGRRTRSVSNGGGLVTMPADVGYDDNNTSGHQALANFQLVSDFITVDRDQKLSVTFPNQDISIKIYDTHNWETAQPIQILHVSFANVPSSQVPMPSLPQSEPYVETVNSNGRIDYTRPQHGPHYWCANYNGCIGLMEGRFNPEYNGDDQQPQWIVAPKLRDFLITGDAAGANNAQIIRGRLDTDARLAVDARADAHGRGLSIMTKGDVIRTLVPAIGDYRTLAAMYEVPASWWRPHPMWRADLDELKMAHSFTGFWATSEPGAKIALQYKTTVMKDMPEPPYDDSYQRDLQLVGGARFDLDSKDNAIKSLHRGNGDLPPDEGYAIAANAFGDFDTGVTSAREGPYINKPDEGNFYAGNQTLSGQTKYWRSAYFYETYENTDDWRSGIYITPNRLISSPVMFGSLPTGVFGTNSLPKAQDRATSLGNLDFAPWQTLLFRPHAQITSAVPYSNASHPGLQDPSDHYLLDLFFMPVVEPYAISEPLSVAGRINMNYQIMPFINIRRATAMHAVMKGEYITAIPSAQIVAAKNYFPGGVIAWNERFWNDTQDRRYWHRPVDPQATLRQFDLKFGHRSGGSRNYQGLFRSASQICEMHLIPKIVNNGVGITNPADMRNASDQASINSTMNTFWGANRVTGDNVRERPYSNLYSRLTTRSNTFRVHVRSQVLRKARSTAADTFDPDKDVVNGEYRGSYLIERFIDPNDPAVTIPDYATTSLSSAAPLDTFYNFRTLETKRFNP